MIYFQSRTSNKWNEKTALDFAPHPILAAIQQPQQQRQRKIERGQEYPDSSGTSHLFSGGRRPDTAFQRYRNSRLGGEFHSEITGRSLSECLDECLRQTSFQCRSAVYSDRFRTCRLSRYNQKDGMRIIYDADYDYYENLMRMCSFALQTHLIHFIICLIFSFEISMSHSLCHVHFHCFYFICYCEIARHCNALGCCAVLLHSCSEQEKCSRHRHTFLICFFFFVLLPLAKLQ